MKNAYAALGHAEFAGLIKEVDQNHRMLSAENLVGHFNEKRLVSLSARIIARQFA